MKNISKKNALAIGVFASSALFGSALLTPNSFAVGMGNPAFTDQNFYECVVRQFDASFPGEITIAENAYETVLSDAQLAKMTTLRCHYGDAESFAPSTKIKNIDGVQLLTSLRYFGAGSQSITTMNFSANTEIKDLSIGGNPLTSLDITKLTKLYWMQASWNQLQTLDVSNSPELETLFVNDNKLQSLDLSANTKLKEIRAYTNRLTGLTLPKSETLINLNIGSNLLPALNISDLPNLRWIEASWNQIQTLDASNNKALETIAIHDNKLSSIKLPNSEALKYVNTTNNSLSAIDASMAPNLTTLFADDVVITPYVEYGVSDCVLTASIKFLGQYNTVPNTNDYIFDNNSHIIFIKQFPTSGYIVTEETSGPEEGYNADSTYRLALGDELKTKLASLNGCESSDVKVPDTGSFTQDKKGLIAGISAAVIATASIIVYCSRHFISRQKSKVHFGKK